MDLPRCDGFGDDGWFQTIILTSLGIVLVTKLAKWRLMRIDDRASNLQPQPEIVVVATTET